MHYLLDSNIIIYYFNGLLSNTKTDELLHESFNVSVITEIEFLGWHKFLTQADLYAQAQAFISHATIYPLDPAIIKQTITLRQTHNIKTPDAIIAATAICHNMQIVTNNNCDFEGLGIETLSIPMKA